MKILLTVLLTLGSLTTLAQDLQYQACSEQDIQNLRDVAADRNSEVDRMVVGLSYDLTTENCEVASPLLAFPAVCGATNWTNIHYKIKLNGTYNVVTNTHAISCLPESRVPMRITEFSFKL